MNEHSLYLHRVVNLAFAGLALLMLANRVHAQVALEEETVGVHYSIVPVLGYNSDFGLFGGGYMQRINYGPGIRPFINSMSVELTASTGGNLISVFDYEQLESFGTNIRSRIRFEGLRLLGTPYFGIGNNTGFSGADYEEGYYYYEERTVALRYWGRMKLSRIGESGSLEAQLLATASYMDPVPNGSQTLFSQVSPPGSGGGWVNRMGAGLIVDERDSEFNPARGYRLEANTLFSGRYTGSSYGFTGYKLDVRGYFSPIRNLVVAQKIEIQHVHGSVPFWHLPVLGSENGLRGYVHNRFRGESSVLHMLEIRAWLFEMFDGAIRLGGQTFMDTGRVFTGGDRVGDLATGLKQTFGFGGAMSIVNPDFIFRGDLAFSEDTYRIYFGVGYVF